MRTAELIESEKNLVNKYNPDYIKNNSTRHNYLENLYTIDLLDRFLSIEFNPELNVLDIGCKNWFYAKGEYFFFKNYCEKLKLAGIELDANRLYDNFYSRAEVAKFNIKDLEGANFIEGDFLKHFEKYDYIVWFLPFVVEYPHISWGLPLKYFKPAEMLLHAFDLLNAGGKIFIVNQGKDEFEVQKALCESLNLPCKPIGFAESKFLKYQFDRYITIIEK